MTIYPIFDMIITPTKNRYRITVKEELGIDLAPLVLFLGVATT
jgi:hypothetical protein